MKVISLLVSATFLAVFIGNVSAFMIGLDRYIINADKISSGKRFHEILDEVNQYITYKGFGEKLRQRIMQYYHFKYSGGKFFDENRILSELNHPLRQVAILI